MPLRIKLKIALIICCVVAILLTIAGAGFPILASLCAIAAILYVEMIYPQWNFFGRAITHVRESGRKTIALTFDDGPSLWTPRILDALKKHNVRATFFMCGKNVERHPEIARRIEAEGHSIGFHSFDHQKYHKRGLSFIKADLDRAASAFRSAGLRDPQLIRFPHGVKNIFAVLEAKRRGLSVCAWNLGVWDPDLPGSSILAERCLRVKAGEILLLHDGYGARENPDRKQVAECVEMILPELLHRGFEFVTLQPQALAFEEKALNQARL